MLLRNPIMDADENLAALKKAYADVILRISEEAAGRIIVLERKSLNYQHELKMAKEEGVRMLLRLKQMMDHQVREAETASLSQQEKIAELEAQLEEAEDIVRDLREELEEVHAELERVRKENLSRVREPDRFCSGEVPTENEIHSCRMSDPEYVVSLDVGIPHGNECSLPSIISRNKDPGLYRNGCTQRIRACEGNHMESDLCLLDKIRAVNKTSKRTASGAKTVTELDKELLSDIDLGRSQSFPCKRKRTTRRRKTAIASGRKQSFGLAKPKQLAKDSLIRDSVLFSESAHLDGNSTKTSPRLSEGKAKAQGQSSYEQTSREDITSVMITYISEGFKTKMEIGEYAEEVDVPSSKANSSLSEAVNVISSPLLNGKVVKFTYQRKRKREALSRTEENASPKTEKKTKDRQSDRRKVGKSKLAVAKEKAREQRRLAQVARQLLSLSGRKWWD